MTNLKKILLLVLFSFCFSTTVAVFVQFVFLPKIAPHLHFEDGLLINHDAKNFHYNAKLLLQKMEAEGLGAWSLSPGLANYQPAGVAALFYYFFLPEPWVLIPFNALIHSLSTLILYFVLRELRFSQKVSLLLSLGFTIMPSPAFWYAQIHRDGVFILSLWLFTLGCVKFLYAARNVECKKNEYLQVVLLFFGSSILFYGTRDYFNVIALGGMTVVFLSALSLNLLSEVRSVLKVATLSCLFIISASSFLLWDYLQKGGSSIDNDFIEVKLENKNDHVLEGSESTSHRTQEKAENVVVEKKPKSHQVYPWQDARRIPNFIENRFYSLATARNVFLDFFGWEGSIIDRDIRFFSVGDIFNYVPRALQISLLAPFPDMWIDLGKKGESGFQRKLSGLEMILVYIGLISLLLAICVRKIFAERLIIVSVMLIMILPFALTIPGIGTFYRMRFGMICIITCIGIGTLLEIYFRRRDHVKKLS